ncbi:MAG: hypothetical protein PHQ89_00745 [Bacilli bacterium]|nr:hypothetical protein [Bacilli bacterium]
MGEWYGYSICMGTEFNKAGNPVYGCLEVVELNKNDLFFTVHVGFKKNDINHHISFECPFCGELNYIEDELVPAEIKDTLITIKMISEAELENIKNPKKFIKLRSKPNKGNSY